MRTISVCVHVVNMTSQWANFFIEYDPSTKSQDNQRFRKIEIYVHKIVNSNSNINVYRTFNNNVIVHKTQNKLPEPKYLATEIKHKHSKLTDIRQDHGHTWKSS